jgi:cytochrome b
MRVRIWDLPTRVAHVLMILLLATLWVTAENGWMLWHRVAGYVVLTLTVFRLYWGLGGSTTARFSHFLRGPRAVRLYLGVFFSKSSQAPSVGHNPLGGWNVLSMIGLLLLQAGLGLFAVDEYGIESGPLATHVSFETGRRVAALHATVFNLLMLLICVHVVAVLAHFIFKRENLISPMLTGVKKGLSGEPPALSFSTTWHALLAVALSALAVLALISTM